MLERAYGFKSRPSHQPSRQRSYKLLNCRVASRFIFESAAARRSCRCSHSAINVPLRPSETATFVALSSKLSIFDQKGFPVLVFCLIEAFIIWQLRYDTGMAHGLLHVLAFRSNILMKKPDTSIRLLTLAEAAGILKISKRTLHRMIQNRQIPAFKVGGQWRILESRFQEWVQEEENTTPKAS